MILKRFISYFPAGEANVKRAESGQSLVEFALVLPLFLAIVFGIIDAGWMGYQAAAFNYSYANASWELASSSIVDYDYRAVGAGTVSNSVAETAIKDSLAASALPGYDPNEVSVAVQDITLENSQSNYTIPDRKGDESAASRVERRLNVKATVVYHTKPLVGFSLFSTSVEKNLEFTRLVGVEHRE